MIRSEDIEGSPGVRLITFDRPEARNAFNAPMYDATTAALTAAREDDSVRVVILTGAGSAFTAGQDLRELTAIAQARSDGNPVAHHGFPGMLEVLSSFDKPLIAAVNGPAIGLGFTLLPHVDIVLVGESARMRVPFAEFAVPPEAASSYLLAQRLGWQRAAMVLFTGQWVSAQDALDWGLALSVHPDADLLAAAVAQAEQIASASVIALRGIKRLMQAWQRPHIEAALAAEADAYASQLGFTTTIPDPPTTREA